MTDYELPDDAPAGATVDDDPDEMARELSALVDDALGYVRPGISLDPAETARDAALWSAALRLSAINRREHVGTLTPDDLAYLAAESGIVPPSWYDPTADFRQMQAELLDVYGSWRAQAFADRMERADETRGHRSGYDAVLARGFRGWPGDIDADYDRSDEAFALSPSGRWANGNLPPVYMAGWPDYVRAGLNR